MKRMKRITASILCVILCVSLNFNPLAIIASSIINSGIVDRFENLKDNLSLFIDGQLPINAYAEETPTGSNIPMQIPMDVRQNISTYANSTEGATIDDLNNKLSSILTSTNSIKTNMNSNYQTITGIIGYQNGGSLESDLTSIKSALGYDPSISGHSGNVATDLQNIQSKLDELNGNINEMQHSYRVAHLYSMNNMFRDVLYRPYSSEVPYIKDFATVTGEFANVYTGYWDTAVTDLTKTFRFVDDNDEDGYQYEFNRYYEVLGDDVVIRSEGLIPQNNVSKVITVGDTSTHWGEGKETPTNNIVMYTQEFIPEDEILWVDAVTVLYKALNQHEYNYQTYMAKNPSITPETSPAYQNLSNVVPDDNGLYNGYDFYMFISRNNKIEASNAEDEPTYNYVYWSKAVREGFVNPGQDPEETILAKDFYILAEDMMMAYGEPYINDDEVKALLQVYGSDYPVQLGAQIADAWAFLKVRGCLDVPLQPTDTLNRAQLLDICTRIADEEYRSDYKVINVVLDLSDLFRDNGYYPVYDLKTTADAFQTSVVYDYKDMTEYTYLIPKTNDVNLGDVGALKVYTSPSKDDSTILKTASTNNHTLEFADNEFYVVKIPIDYTKNFYIAKTLEGAGSTNGTVDFIEVPATGLGGGIYIGGYSINNNIATLDVSSSNVVSFTEYSQDKAIVKFADYNRAERDKPVASTVSSNATTLEKISFYWDMWTSPMTAYAAEETTDSGAGLRVNLTDTDNSWNVSEIDEVKHYTSIKDVRYSSSNGISTYSFYTTDNANCNSTKYVNTGSKTLTKQLNRLVTLTEYPELGDFIKNCGSITDYFAASEGSGSPVLRNSNEYKNLSNSANTNKSITFKDAKTGNDVNATVNGNSAILKYILGLNPNSSLINHKCLENGSIKVDFTKDLTLDVIKRIYNYSGGYIGSGISEGKNCDTVELYKLSNLAKTYDVKNAKSEKKGSYELDCNNPESFLASLDFSKEVIDSSYEDIKGQGDSKLLNYNVASSAVMRKDEQILVSWTDLVNSGYVIPKETGGQPDLQSDGSYHFYTENGQVKVNDNMHTIQIGTTLYDLSREDGTTPQLVYIDHEQQDEIYFDVRCVMGIIKEDVNSEGSKIELPENSMGQGKRVVYDLGSSGNASTLWKSKKLTTFNFPDVPETSFGTYTLANVTGYNTNLVMETKYDKVDTDRGKYWDTANVSRINMSTFVPTANWLFVIDDNGDGGVTGKLFIYYPAEPFINGYDNTSQGDTQYISENTKEREEYYSNYQDKVKNASALNSGRINLSSILDSTYGGSGGVVNEWYYQMTYAAVADLYSMTGTYYLSKDYVVRCVDISNNTVIRCETVFSPDDDTTGMMSNKPGSVYWIDSMGYVYNMPTVSEFNLKDYFEGKYLLPLAIDNNCSFRSTPSIINYNLNYYGSPVYKNSSGEIVTGNPLKYGNVLSSNGWIHYKSLSHCTYDGTTLSNSNLPLSSDTANTDGYLDVPLDIQQFKAAPSGIYFYFGRNPSEVMSLNSVTTFVTQAHKVYYGTSQIIVGNSDTTSTDKSIQMFSKQYKPVSISSSTNVYRVMKAKSQDTLILEPYGLTKDNADGVGEVLIDDYVPNPLEDFLKDAGTNDLLTAIEKGSSWLIIIAFKVLPIIGIILMTILIGLSFICDTKIFRVICEKTIDPIRILTFGGKDVNSWHWKKVLFPCIILYLAFALFLNGNIIRIIMWIAEWYGVVSRWIKSI